MADEYMAETIKKNQISEQENAQQIKARKLIYLVLAQYFKVTITALTLASLLSGYFFILRPKYSAVNREIKEAYESKQAELDDLNLYFSRLQKYVSTYQALSDGDKKIIDTMLPAKAEYEKLFTSLEALIKKQQLILTSLKITPPGGTADTEPGGGAASVNKEVGEISFEMEIVGVNYQGLKNLLSTIENNLNLIDIEKVEWSPGERTVTLKMRTYYLNF